MSFDQVVTARETAWGIKEKRGNGAYCNEILKAGARPHDYSTLGSTEFEARSKWSTTGSYGVRYPVVPIVGGIEGHIVDISVTNNKFVHGVTPPPFSVSEHAGGNSILISQTSIINSVRHQRNVSSQRDIALQPINRDSFLEEFKGKIPNEMNKYIKGSSLREKSIF
jgi:hypothetical protein